MSGGTEGSGGGGGSRAAWASPRWARRTDPPSPCPRPGVAPSLPPASLTRMLLSTNLARSSALSLPRAAIVSLSGAYPEQAEGGGSGCSGLEVRRGRRLAAWRCRWPRSQVRRFCVGKWEPVTALDDRCAALTRPDTRQQGTIRSCSALVAHSAFGHPTCSATHYHIFHTHP